MKISLILVGKTKERYLQEGISEYLKRLKRYAPVSTLIIPDLKVSKKTTWDQIKLQEGQQILHLIKPNDFVILLDERGEVYSSEGFARYLLSLEGKVGHCIFVIGGAYGFSDEIYQRANARLSLSAMTFSHQMVRLIFTEQLYRAFTILKGEPYHHK